MNLDALIALVSRTIEMCDDDEVGRALIHVDTLRDIYEELTRLKDLEK